MALVSGARPAAPLGKLPLGDWVRSLASTCSYKAQCEPASNPLSRTRIAGWTVRGWQADRVPEGKTSQRLNRSTPTLLDATSSLLQNENLAHSLSSLSIPIAGEPLLT